MKLSIGRPLSNDTTSSTILLEERALEWLVNDDMLQLTPDSRLHQVQLQQRYGLATLYVNMFDAASSSSSATSECQWTGITCDAATASIVTKIELGTGSTINAWVGADSRRSLSVDLALLTSLQSFDVSNSGLIGSIPSSLGPAWSSSLHTFDVHTNALTGSLPSSIGEWTQLQDFKVHDNALTGNIPSSISMWSRTIKEAAFDNNPGLTGTMPDALCQANTPDLVYLAADEDMPCSCCHCC
jgi:hypothetical protein